MNTENTSITAKNAGRGRLALLIAFFLFSYLAGQVGHAQTAAPGENERLSTGNVVTVNPAVTHQTMRGWEVVAQADQFRPDYAAYQNVALNKVVEAGINRVRFEVRSGSENTADSFGEWQAAGYPDTGGGYTAWRTRRYETINDNADPNVINPAGFKFTEIDSTVDLIINPLRQRMAAQGESLYVNMTYVAFLGQVTSGAPYVHAAAAEYAEFMLATFQHLQQKYGWVPNAIEVILEPDNTPNPWNGTFLGQVIVATGQRLAANGFTPDFIGPATMCMSAAITYFDQMMAVPNVSTYLKEVSYHRYCWDGASVLQTLAARAQTAGLATSMLEWWDANNTFNTLHEDLKVGRNSAWQQSTIVHLATATGLQISHVNPATPTVAVLSNSTKFTQQYYKYVRRGAVRVDAATNNSGFDPLAFRNPDGKYTVVVKAGTNGPFSIDGLPAGTYGIYYTASSAWSPADPNLYAVSKPDQTIAAGQAITTDIPAYGVITIYGKTGGSPLPISANDVYATGFNTPLTVAAPGVLSNDNANGGGAMTAVLPSAASSGSVALNTNGGFTYTPASAFTGAATFTYRASTASGQSNVATVTVNVGPPALPTATSDAYPTAFNTALTVATPGVLGNDNANGGGAMTAVLQTGASSGTVALNANGSFGYTPASGFSGAATFTYSASTTSGQSNVATVTITVAGPGLPTATSDTYPTAFNTALTVAAPGVLGNDNANGGGAMTAVLQTGASSGTVALNANGSFGYTPASGFSGAATFTYRASTAGGQSNTATVTVNVAPPGPPTAANDTYGTAFNTPLTVVTPGVLGNDNANGGGAMTAVLQTGASSGTVALNANGSFGYTPASGFSGAATFTYQASTAGGQSNTATVTVNVATTGSPTATNDSYTTAHNSVLNVPASGILANDSANGGGTLTAVLESAVSSGTVSLSFNGRFVYTPANGFTGVATFTYRASNSAGQSNIATVSVNVTAPNPPEAVDDTYTAFFNMPLTVAAPGVLANDNGNGGGTLTAVAPSPATHGSVAVSANGSFTYTPAPGFSGPVTFTYRASNSSGPSDGATVTINVAASGSPVTADDRYNTAFDAALNVPSPGVLSNDNTWGGGTMSATVVSSTSSGSLSLTPGGGFAYTPNGGFSGVDTFTYRASNASGAGTTATVTISVAGFGEPLPPTSVRVTAIEGNSVTFGWVPPQSGPRPTGYQIEGGLAPGETTGVVAVGSVPFITVEWPRGSFYLRVRTLSDDATSSASNEVLAHVDVPVPPSTPANLLGTVVGDTFNLAWTNTYLGGPLDGVTLNVSGAVNGSSPLGLADTFSFQGVPGGVYTFTVEATNGNGASVPSNPVTLTFPTQCSQAPQSVVNFVAYQVGGVMFLNWDSPVSGGAPANYVLNVTGSYYGSLPTPLKALNGPVPAGTYTLEVVATNPCGASAGSGPLTVVVP